MAGRPPKKKKEELQAVADALKALGKKRKHEDADSSSENSDNDPEEKPPPQVRKRERKMTEKLKAAKEDQSERKISKKLVDELLPKPASAKKIAKLPEPRRDDSQATSDSESEDSEVQFVRHSGSQPALERTVQKLSAELSFLREEVRSLRRDVAFLQARTGAQPFAPNPFWSGSAPSSSVAASRMHDFNALPSRHQGPGLVLKLRHSGSGKLFAEAKRARAQVVSVQDRPLSENERDEMILEIAKKMHPGVENLEQIDVNSLSEWRKEISRHWSKRRSEIRAQ